MGDASALRDVWRNLGPRGQVGIVASVLLVVVTFFFLYRTAAQPSYTTLLTGLEPSESAQVGDTLSAQGIAWKLESGGTQIAVSKGTEDEARVALAKEGLPNGGHVGFELFDKQSFGTTDFQQRVNYQRALEGEIARTIEGIQGVRAAQIQLVLPDESLFTDESTKATAAVLVAGGSMLDAATISGVAHLVSSSVKRLASEDVTITDEQGNLLWPRGQATEGGLGGVSKMEAEQRYDARLSAQINAMIAQTLGPDKAQARVHSDLNVDSRTIDSVTYARRGTPLSENSETEGLQAEGGSGQAATGSTAAAAAAAGARTSNYRRNRSQTEYGVDRTVERRVIAPGAVNRLDVALLVDTSVPKKQVEALRSSVAALAGIDASRGDTLAVSTIAFAKPVETEAPAAGGAPVPPVALEAGKWVGLGLGLVAFAFVLRRGLTRREREPLTVEPTWLREIERAMPVNELEAITAGNGNGNGAASAAQAQVLREQVEEIVRKQPEQIAMQVGTWMKER